MASAYEEVDLLDMTMEVEEEMFTFPCPCGDVFFIPIDDLLDNEDKAKCLSCSLILQVNYQPEELDVLLAKFEGKM